MSQTFTVDEQFIRDAYDDACTEWKEKLKAKFPDAFKPAPAITIKDTSKVYRLLKELCKELEIPDGSIEILNDAMPEHQNKGLFLHSTYIQWEVVTGRSGQIDKHLRIVPFTK